MWPRGGVKLSRELSMSAADTASLTVTSHLAAASRLRQLSRTFHMHLTSSSTSSSSSLPSVDMLRTSSVS